MKEPVAVVIPIYKEIITDMELLSLTQCLKILHPYKLIFCAAESLNTKFYETFCKGKIHFSIERFENQYFKDIDGYNKLMLSTSYYKRFLNYKFILIYQLDAFVFKDDLLYWCNQNYDFIGAPHSSYNNDPGEMQFLKNYKKLLKLSKLNHEVSNVGNGGFSLRKTRSFYFLLKILKSKVQKSGSWNEDGFIEYWGNLFYPFFKLPTDEIALNFSIETSPKELLKKTSNTLPFGCHAFEKYDWEIWKPYILDKK
jgi:hypothetical protein